MNTLTSFVLFGVACFVVGVFTGYVLRGSRTWVMDDGDEPPPEEPAEDEEEDLSEVDTQEIKRIRDGFGDPIYIQISPLIRFRNPLDIANMEFDRQPVPATNGHHTNGGTVKLGLWDSVQFAVAMMREPPTMDMDPYRGKHRADGRTAHDIENLNTTTMLIPILEHTKPNGHTMEMPWKEGELVLV